MAPILGQRPELSVDMQQIHLMQLPVVVQLWKKSPLF
jgi:hypothetical protein